MLAAALSATTLGAAQDQVEAKAPRASLVVIRSDGAEACPDADVLAERVRAVAGANVIGVGVSAASIETWVQVAISRNFGGYGAQIRTSGTRHGSRSLEDVGPTCESLADAVAITIAMFLDPYESTPAPRAPAPIVSEKLADPKAPAATGPAKQPRYFVDGSAGFAFNLLAHTQPFVGASAGFRPNTRWSVALGGVFVLPDRTSDGTPRVDLGLSFASLQLCAHALGDIDHVSLTWCAAPQLGSLTGSGSGYQDNLSERALWLAIAIGPEAAFRLTRSLSWALAAQGVIPLLTQGFDVERDGVRSSAFQSPSVAGLVSLGLRVHL